ncbi:MAG: aspartate/glutamate racemase family protein [Rhodospirillaceae bacterium]|nr:aspartate/glutamate racemase family protein [Rhodospirillaceae bacterium]
MIGVFDSGHGGLTVLSALCQRLPRQGFIYLGDHAHAPYGSRAPGEIVELTRSGVATLFGLGCTLVILACNTAAAVALRRLQQDWLPDAFPNHRCLGVLVPMIEAVAQNPWHAVAGPDEWGRVPETLGVFATPATVASGAYLHEVAKRAPRLTVFQQACPDLAGLIEAGADAATLRAAIDRHVGDMQAQLRGTALDSVVLGCTHYPLVEHHFRAALPAGTRLLSQPQRTAEALTAYLFRHPEMKRFGAQPGLVRAYTTGDPERVTLAARNFLADSVLAGHLAFQALPHTHQVRQHA